MSSTIDGHGTYRTIRQVTGVSTGGTVRNMFMGRDLQVSRTTPDVKHPYVECQYSYARQQNHGVSRMPLILEMPQRPEATQSFDCVANRSSWRKLWQQQHTGHVESEHFLHISPCYELEPVMIQRLLNII